MYVELYINILWLKLPNVGFLILEEQNQILDKKPSYKTSRNHRLEYDVAGM